MSVASLGSIIGKPRMPQMVLFDLSLSLMTAFETSDGNQPMMPLAEGVMFADWPIIVPDVTGRPPWNALAALMRVGVSFARSAVWQVTHNSVARYLPLAAPVPLPFGRSLG